jgi:hypothetical protein
VIGRASALNAETIRATTSTLTSFSLS